MLSQPSMAILTSASASAAAKKKGKVAAAGAKKTKTTAAAAAGRTAPSAKTTTAARKPSTAKSTAPKKKEQPVASAAAAKRKSNPAASKPEGSKKVLVIVESPAKARTITELLKKAAAGGGGGGELYKGYTVDACNGHVTDLVGKRRDVPAELKEQTKGWDVVGVDVENDFKPLYIQNPKKKAIITRLKKASAKCDEIILATDEDREGEAISWHLLQVLEPKVPVKRAVFHEITQEALVKAFEVRRQML
ncbi:unnamed protein product [Ectocarpus sp. CCAP 1310/34]|nr:unnamed protein product [Ectocarpus sp. CCAP 1310/34]